MTKSAVPHDWRNANVTPLFKEGKRTIPQNYRPVSLTSQVSKLMESIIRDCIIEHLKEHKLVKGSQHGFVSGKSCLTNLLLFLEEVTQYIDKGYPVDVIYLDFAKAFDKVPHQRLLLKMKAHGITGDVCNWIEAWLKNRQQRVVVNGCKSSWTPVLSGVPQGSVLGPTLFVIYINDIEDSIASRVLKFADDTKLIKKVATTEEAFTLQDDLHKMFEWSKE